MLWNPTSPAKNKGRGSLLSSLKEFFSFNVLIEASFQTLLKGRLFPPLA